MIAPTNTVRSGAHVGRCIAISGAGRGLGAALAISLARDGTLPVLCGRSHGDLREVAEAIKAENGMEAPCIPCDLADHTSVERAIVAILALPRQIDGVINNGAAWLAASENPLSAAEVAQAVNSAVSGTFLLTQGLFPALEQADPADIVIVGSINGLPNVPIRTVSVPFHAAKHAQTGLADALRQRFHGTSVRVSIVHPPYLDEIDPLSQAWSSSPDRKKGERATNRDVVDAILFMLTRPRHVTVATLVLDADRDGLIG